MFDFTWVGRGSSFTFLRFIKQEFTVRLTHPVAVTNATSAGWLGLTGFVGPTWAGAVCKAQGGPRPGHPPFFAETAVGLQPRQLMQVQSSTSSLHLAYGCHGKQVHHLDTSLTGKY